MSDPLSGYIMRETSRIRYENLARSPQITLGRLIGLLEEIEDKSKALCFDFAGLCPGDLMSWRGAYDELAIDPTRAVYLFVTVSNYLPHLRDAVMTTFTGYNGGKYIMDRDTPLWVAAQGCVGNTAVVGIKEMDTCVLIRTAEIEFSLHSC